MEQVWRTPEPREELAVRLPDRERRDGQPYRHGGPQMRTSPARCSRTRMQLIK